MILSPSQLHILQHSLGCDEFGRTDYRGQNEDDHCWHYHRNRFITDPFRGDGLICDGLVGLGLMEDLGPWDVAGGAHYYRVTEAGRDAMIAQSPKPPILTAGQKMYREWKDADCGLEFGEWLKVRKDYERDYLGLAPSR